MLLISQKSIFNQTQQITGAFRVFRLIRSFKLFKGIFSGLQRLIDTMIFSFWMLITALGLYILSLTQFSFIGIYLFQGLLLSEYLQFNNFLNALFALFTLSNGEQWSQIMFHSMKHYNQSVCLYWICFIFINNFLLLQLFVIILLNVFQEFYINENNPIRMICFFQTDFNNVFSQYVKDKQNKKFIDSNSINSLCMKLAKPLGAQIEFEITEFESIYKFYKKKFNIYIINNIKRAISKIIMKKLMKVKIVLINKKVYYKQLFYHLAKLHYFNQAIQKANKKQLNFLLQSNQKTQQKILIEAQKQLNKLPQKQKQYYNPTCFHIIMRMCLLCWQKQSKVVIQRKSTTQVRYKQKNNQFRKQKKLIPKIANLQIIKQVIVSKKQE